MGVPYYPSHWSHVPSGDGGQLARTGVRLSSAGGMPLAFMQEDFLVYIFVSIPAKLSFLSSRSFSIKD